MRDQKVMVGNELKAFHRIKDTSSITTEDNNIVKLYGGMEKVYIQVLILKYEQYIDIVYVKPIMKIKCTWLDKKFLF